MLCYGSEAWTIRKSDENGITACEMKFMRRTAGYTKWDLKSNEEVLKERKVEPIWTTCVDTKPTGERMSTG
jgi:hypothetical protein